MPGGEDDRWSHPQRQDRDWAALLEETGLPDWSREERMALRDTVIDFRTRASAAASKREDENRFMRKLSLIFAGFTVVLTLLMVVASFVGSSLGSHNAPVATPLPTSSVFSPAPAPSFTPTARP